MSNKKLSDEMQEQINSAAESYSGWDGDPNSKTYPINKGRYYGYVRGSTAVHERAQAILYALDQFISFHESGLLPARHVYENAIAVRQQWKQVKDKGPEQEIEYMPVHPEDARKPGCPKQVPMSILDEAQAQRNHGQTLKRLKERGGLGVLEMLAIIDKKPWSYYRDLKWQEALNMLNDSLTNPQQ